MNLWTMLLAGLNWFFNAAIVPLFGGMFGFHQAMGLAETMGSGAYVTLELAWATFGMFNLGLVFVAVGLNIIAWFIDLAVRIYMLIKSLIPVIG